MTSVEITSLAESAVSTTQVLDRLVLFMWRDAHLERSEELSRYIKALRSHESVLRHARFEHRIGWPRPRYVSFISTLIKLRTEIARLKAERAELRPLVYPHSHVVL